MMKKILFSLLCLIGISSMQVVKANALVAKLDGTTMTINYLQTAPDGYKTPSEWGEWKSIVTKVVFNDNMKYCHPTSTKGWFKGFSKLTTIEDISYLNTEDVTDMSEMFSGCSSLVEIDLFYTQFNTSNVTKMNSMFSGCSSATSIRTSNFDTKNVTDMSSMFANCASLILPETFLFDTKNVTKMESMFYGCEAVTFIDCGSFDMSNVTTTYGMFRFCANLKSIYCYDDWSKLTNITSSNYMFLGCTSLEGWNGTAYSEDHTDKEYARLDYAQHPGYFRKGNFDENPCSKPTNIHTTALGKNNVTIVWDGENDVYVCSLRKKGETSWPTPQGGTGNLKPYSSLDPGTTYEFEVATYCTSKAVSDWEYFEFTTVDECSAPYNLQFNNLTSNGVTLKWTGNALTHTDYTVNWKKSTASEYNTMYTSNTYQNLIGYLEPGTTYDVQIIAKCGTNNYSDPLEGQFTTPMPECPVPDVWVDESKTTSSSLTVCVNSTSGEYWNIRYRKDGASTWTLGGGPNKTMVLTDLEPATWYLIQAQTSCGSGWESAWTPSIQFRTAAETPIVDECEKPVNIQASDITSTSMVISWTGHGEEEWTLWYEEKDNSNGKNGRIDNITTNSYKLEELDPNTTYMIQLLAVCTSQNSSWTDAVEFTTAAGTPVVGECVTPSVSVKDVETTTATITWTPGSTDQAAWNVRWRVNDGEASWVTRKATTATYPLSSLTPNTQYEVQVQADCGNGNTSDWDNYFFITKAEEGQCVPPTNIQFTYENGAVKATWTPGGNEYSWNYQMFYFGNMFASMYTAEPESETIDVLPGDEISIVIKSYCGNDIYSEPSEKVTITIPDPEGIEEVMVNDLFRDGQKFLIDGMLYIRANGHLYDAQGKLVK